MNPYSTVRIIGPQFSDDITLVANLLFDLNSFYDVQAAVAGGDAARNLFSQFFPFADIRFCPSFCSYAKRIRLRRWQKRWTEKTRNKRRCVVIDESASWMANDVWKEKGNPLFASKIFVNAQLPREPFESMYLFFSAADSDYQLSVWASSNVLKSVFATFDICKSVWDALTTPGKGRFMVIDAHVSRETDVARAPHVSGETDASRWKVFYHITTRAWPPTLFTLPKLFAKRKNWCRRLFE